MINPSIFTYLPPCREANRAFLGFSRYEKEDQVTQESWGNLVNSVYFKVLLPVAEKCNHCCCCSPEITLDRTEVGIVLKKLELPRVKELCEIAMKGLDEIQQTTKKGYPKESLEKVTNFALATLESKGIVYSSYSKKLSTPYQIELNEFKVKMLCKISLEVGIEKPGILKQVKQAADEGYLAPQSFDRIQTILKA